MRRLPGEPDPVDEVRYEMRMHVELRVDALVREGVDPAEARRRVEAEFGDVSAAERECARIERWVRRRRRRAALVSGLRSDARLALRETLAHPVETLLLVATLAVSLAGTTLLAGLVDQALFPDLPLPDADRIARVWTSNPTAGQPFDLSAPRIVQAWRASDAVAAVAAYVGGEATLGAPDAPARVSLLRADGEIFDVLGREPALGRAFGPREDGAVAVLSHGLWRSRFGADPGVVGRPVRLDGRVHVVTGVLPAGVGELFGGDVVVPLRLPEGFLVSPRTLIARTVVRLHPHGTLPGVRHAFEAAMRDAGEGVFGVRVEPFTEESRRAVAPSIRLFGTALGLLGLIGVLSTTGLVLTRTLRRRGTIAVQRALGASWARVSRVLILESIGGLGVAGAVGFTTASALLPVLTRGEHALVPLQTEATLGPAAALVGAATALVVLLPVVVIPLLGVVRGMGAGSLIRDRSTPRSGGGRRLVMGGQLALSVLLLGLAGALVDSARTVSGRDPGIEAAGVVTLDLDLPRGDYPDAEARTRAWDRILTEVRSREAVASASLGGGFVLGDHPRSARFFPESGTGEGVEVVLDDVDPSHPATLGYAPLAGRALSRADDARSEPVMVVDRTTAEALGGSAALLGRSIRIGRRGPTVRVVGVVPDLLREGPGSPPRPTAYRPLAQTAPTRATLYLRATGTADATLAAARSVLTRVAPGVSLDRMSTLGAELAATTRLDRAVAGSASVFGALALLVTLVGIYGMVHQAVAARRHELTIRASIGARQHQLAWAIVGDALRYLGPGLLLGLGAARLAIGPMEGILPARILLSVAALCLPALLLAFLPGLRATLHIDPAALGSGRVGLPRVPWRSR